MTSQKPLPLKIGQYVAAVMATLGTLGLVLALLDVHLFSIGNSLVGGHEFLVQVGLPYSAVVLCTAAIAVGLFRQRAWARPLMVLFWLLCAVYAGLDASKGAGGLSMGVVQGLSVVIAGVIAATYLYASRDATSYFRSLTRSLDSDAAA